MYETEQLWQISKYRLNMWMVLLVRFISKFFIFQCYNFTTTKHAWPKCAWFIYLIMNAWVPYWSPGGVLMCFDCFPVIRNYSIMVSWRKASYFPHNIISTQTCVNHPCCYCKPWLNKCTIYSAYTQICNHGCVNIDLISISGHLWMLSVCISV